MHYPQPLPPEDLPLKDNEVLLEYALGEEGRLCLGGPKRRGPEDCIPFPLGREALEGKVKDFMGP